MIERTHHLASVQALLEWNPVVAILGARQVGKTTLARRLVEIREEPAAFFDLENPADLSLLDDPMLALSGLKGLVVVDEVQRRPDLFPVLRVLADRPEAQARFLVLGSAAPELLRQSSETLAGRIAFYELGPLSLEEVGVGELQRLWLRGGFPRSFLAESDARSARWRYDFGRTFLERDVPALGITIAPGNLERFWSMLAHVHGGLWNGSDLARSFGVSAATVRRYLDVLTSTFLVRELRPWHENLTKRQVKAPKIYFRDSGILHSLLRIDAAEELVRHPSVGASWEGFALECIAERLGVGLDRCYFWRTQAGAELDLLVVEGGRRLGFEIKRTVAPTVSRSMHTALEDLRLDRLDVVHAGERTFPLRDRIRALALPRILLDLERLVPPA